MILPTTKDPRTIFLFLSVSSARNGRLHFGGEEVVKGTILLLFSFSLFLAGRWCIFIARLGKEEDVHRTFSLTTIQSVFYSRRDNMYAARAKNTHNWTHFGPTGWPLGQRVHFVFLFYFSFVYVRWSSSSRAARLTLLRRDDSLNGCAGKLKYTFFFVLFLYPRRPSAYCWPVGKFYFKFFPGRRFIQVICHLRFALTSKVNKRWLP